MGRVIETVAPKGSVKEQDAAPQADVGIEAETVELQYSKDDLMKMQVASENFGEYIARFVKHKYPNKYIAEPSIESVHKAYLGWQPLTLDTATHTVKPVKTCEEAHRRGRLVLAWKPMQLREAEEADRKKRQERMNRFVAMEGSNSQAVDVDNQISGLAKGLRAKPLNDNDD